MMRMMRATPGMLIKYCNLIVTIVAWAIEGAQIRHGVGVGVWFNDNDKVQ
jgi:hypothetical protein